MIPFVRGISMFEALKALLEAAKTAKPSAEHREQQRRSFAFGNTALENELITREMIDRQAEKLSALKRRRDNVRVGRALDNLKRAAEDDKNLIPAILESVRSYATVGEITGALKEIFGTYSETSVL